MLKETWLTNNNESSQFNEQLSRETAQKKFPEKKWQLY